MPNSTANVVDRETAYLTTSGDGLPALLKSAGGRWDNVQSYYPRTPATRQTSIYVLRSRIADVRFANHRKMDTYEIRLVCVWPIGATTTSSGIAEQEQRAFDLAIDDVIARVRDYRGNPATDHTHGNRFLSVAEAPDGVRIDVSFDAPERAFTQSPAVLGAVITYSADDPDATG